MKALEPRDASALSLLAESPTESTKALVLNDLSPEARKIADAMVPDRPIRRKTKAALAKGRKRVAKRVDKAVQSTADALLRWSK